MMKSLTIQFFFSFTEAIREGSEDLKKPAGVFRFPKMEFIMIQDESQNFEGRLFQLAEGDFDRSWKKKKAFGQETRKVILLSFKFSNISTIA